MKVQKVYWCKRRRSPLRVRIDGKAYRCGQHVNGSMVVITRIESIGKIELMDARNGSRWQVECPGIPKVIIEN